MKKTIGLLLAICLILALLPAGAAAANVMLSPQGLTVNGIPIECEKYNIDGSNYFKLRDIAYLLNGTENQFGVGYDNANHTVTVTSGIAYTPNGSELVIGEDKSATAVPSAQTILINGAENTGLSVYNLGGNNYFKLRDLGETLGFLVDYDKASNTAIVESRDFSGQWDYAAPDGAKELSASEIYQKCSPAVFQIRVYDAEGESLGSGSGFFVEECGIAVTNYHVMKNAFSADALLTDGTECPVYGVLFYDSEKDYAVIQVKGSGFPALEVGTSSAVSGGDKVYAIGSPRGLQNTISDGIVSNPSREDYGGMIQITTPISHGSSGGALIDSGGRVIGVTTGSLTSGQNLNFAVPIDPVLAGRDLVSYVNDGMVMTMAQFARLSGSEDPAADDPKTETSKEEAFRALKQWILVNYNDTIGENREKGYFESTQYPGGDDYTLGAVYVPEHEWIVLSAYYQFDDGDHDSSFIFLDPSYTLYYASYGYYDEWERSVFEGELYIDPLTFSGSRDVAFEITDGEYAGTEDSGVFVRFATISFCDSLAFADDLLRYVVSPEGTYGIADFGFDPDALTVPD